MSKTHRIAKAAAASLAVILGVFASPANGFVPCRPGAKVYYLNGVNKSDEQEVADAARFLSLNINHFDVQCVAEVDYLFNPSDGLMADVLGELATQKAAELKVSFADSLLQVGFAAFGMVSSLSEADQLAVRNRVAAFVQATTNSAYTFEIDGKTYSTADLEGYFCDRIRVELGQGTKVVVVAHSQGNMFANDTYNLVRASTPQSVYQGLAVVNVANASLSAPSNLYVTTNQDLIIGVLIAAGVATPANFDATGSYPFDITGHGFSEIYLNRVLPAGVAEVNSVAARVMQLLQQAIDTTPNPVGTIYGSTSSGYFGFNLATNTASMLGRFTYIDSSTTPVWDIAVNPRGGLIYAISPYAISVWSPDVGSLSRLPQASIGGNALAFDADGALYGMGGDRIYKFDPATGQAVELPISLGSYVSSGDLTFDSDGIMFGTITAPDGYDYLLQADLLRSTVKVVGSTGFRSIYGLYFSGGYLYGATSAGKIILIDRETGSASAVAQLPFSGITGLQ